MILLSSERLENALAEANLSEWEKTQYLLLPIVLGALVGGAFTSLLRQDFGGEVPAHQETIMFADGVIMAAISYWGISRAFRTNAKSDGQRFIERFTILSIPVAVKLWVGLFGCVVLLSVVMGRLGLSGPEVRAYFRLAVNVGAPLAYLAFYVLILRSFKRLSAKMGRGAGS